MRKTAVSDSDETAKTDLPFKVLAFHMCCMPACYRYTHPPPPPGSAQGATVQKIVAGCRANWQGCCRMCSRVAHDCCQPHALCSAHAADEGLRKSCACKSCSSDAIFRPRCLLCVEVHFSAKVQERARSPFLTAVIWATSLSPGSAALQKMTNPVS